MAVTSIDPPSRGERDQLEVLLARAAGAVSELGPAYAQHVRALSDLAGRLAEGRLHLAVLGQFKRGKSSLLNALLGQPLLPVGVVPLTTVPTFLQFGEESRIVVKYRGARPSDERKGGSIAEHTDYLAMMVTERGNRRNERGVAEVEIELPAAILSSGVAFIDTPGIGSTYRHNTAATREFLEQCDAALFVVSADPPITEVELEFLRQVRDRIPRLFFVLNKIDYLGERERQEALAFYRRVLTEDAGLDGGVPIFEVSAREGLRARQAHDRQAWAASGMGHLETFLVDYLATQKLATLMDAVALRAIEIVEAVLMEAGIALQALKQPQHELERKLAVFEESLERVERERTWLQDGLAGDRKRVAAWLEGEAVELHRQAEKVLRDAMSRSAAAAGRGKAAKAAIERAWADAIPPFFAEQQAALNERAKARLAECMAPHEQRLKELVETVRRTAADLFQVPYTPSASEEPLAIKRRPYWVLNTWNTEPLVMLQSLDQRLDALARRNVENVRWATLQNLNDAFAGFERRVAQRLDDAAATTKGAIDAALARRRAHGETLASEVKRLEAGIATLAAARTRLGEFRSVSATIVQPNPEPGHPPEANA